MKNEPSVANDRLSAPSDLRGNYAAAHSSLGTSLYLAGSRTEARRTWHQALGLGAPQETQKPQ